MLQCACDQAQEQMYIHQLPKALARMSALVIDKVELSKDKVKPPVKEVLMSFIEFVHTLKTGLTAGPVS